MSKPKKDETVEFLEDLLIPDTSKMSSQEIDEALKNTGIDVVTFNRRVANRAREIATRERREGRSAPPYLRDIVRQLDPEGPLPSHLEDAKQKAKALVNRITGAFTPPPTPTVVASYRKGDKELTESDREILEHERKALVDSLKNDEKAE